MKIDPNMISVVSAIIAFLTAVISGMTYLSQKKTQENTRALVQPSNAIKLYLISCVDIFINLEIFHYYAIKHLFSLKKVKYSRFIISKLQFDLSDFNSNLFYEDETSYRLFRGFKSGLTELNELILGFVNESDYSGFIKQQQINYLEIIKLKLSALYTVWYRNLINLLKKEYAKKTKEKDLSERCQNMFEEIIINHINRSKNYIIETEKERKLAAFTLRRVALESEEFYGEESNDIEKTIANIYHDFILLELIENEENKKDLEKLLKYRLALLEKDYSEMIYK